MEGAVMSHTPGPWKNGGLVGGGHWITDASSNHQIALVYGPRVNSDSVDNTRLIVAAPDLLQILKQIVSSDAESEYEDIHYVSEDLVSIARVIIANAEGRS
jgi:hypothetical protein